MTQERVIDKVLKLLAKAESTTPEEAEALTAKASELMIRAEIDEAMLARATGRTTDEIIERRIEFKGSYSAATRSLMGAIGRGYGFHFLVSNGTNKRWGYWVGWRSDIEAAETLLTSLLIQQKRAVDAFVKTNPPPEYATAQEKFIYRRSFMFGFAEGVGEQLTAQRAQTIERVEAERSQAGSAKTADVVSDSVALVLRDKQQQVNDWYDKRYGKLRASRSRTLTNHTSRSAGSAAGRKANLATRTVGGRRALGS